MDELRITEWSISEAGHLTVKVVGELGMSDTFHRGGRVNPHLRCRWCGLWLLPSRVGDGYPWCNKRCRKASEAAAEERERRAA